MCSISKELENRFSGYRSRGLNEDDGRAELRARITRKYYEPFNFGTFWDSYFKASGKIDTQNNENMYNFALNSNGILPLESVAKMSNGDYFELLLVQKKNLKKQENGRKPANHSGT